MDCEQVRELEAAYALNALDEAERRAVRDHLAGCGDHAHVVQLRAVTVALAGEAGLRQPTAALRERVVAIGADRRAASRRLLWPWYAAAAILVVSIAAGTIALMTRGESDSAEPYVREFATGAGISVRVEANFDQRRTEVVFRGLEHGGDYEFWAIRGEEWLSMGQFRANAEGGWAGEFVFGIQPNDSVCLTERTGDDTAGPFGDPLFIEPLAKPEA